MRFSNGPALHKPKIVRLTDREREVLWLTVQGRSRKYIAEKLFISPRTVDYHIQNCRCKMGESRPQAAYVEALKRGEMPCLCQAIAAMNSADDTKETLP